jgi:hypothetical protein
MWTRRLINKSCTLGNRTFFDRFESPEQIFARSQRSGWVFIDDEDVTHLSPWPGIGLAIQMKTCLGSRKNLRPIRRSIAPQVTE